MRSLIPALALICAVLTFRPVLAVEAEVNPAVNKLIRLSGIRDQIQQYPAIFVSSVDQQESQLPPETFKAAKRIMESKFLPERLESEVAAELNRNFDPAYATAVLAWLESPLGRTITELEVSNTNPDEIAKANEFLESAECEETPEGRLQLINRMMAATNAVESNVAIYTSAPSKILTGLNENLPSESRMSDEFLEALLNEQRRMVRAAMTKLMPQLYLYMYRNLPDDELETYVLHLESEAGTWYSENVAEGLVTSISGILDEVNLEVMQAILESKDAPKTANH